MIIHKIIEGTTVNGPGLRLGIWVQGCKRNCLGCFNEEVCIANGGTQMTIEQIVKLLDKQNYDGITVIDNTGRIRAYNCFVETSMNNEKNIIGGARKRAAYTLINTKVKKIIGVYFQSHEGEMFYIPVRKNKRK